jgi:hypothetical protein
VLVAWALAFEEEEVEELAFARLDCEQINHCQEH